MLAVILLLYCIRTLAELGARAGTAVVRRGKKLYNAAHPPVEFCTCPDLIEPSILQLQLRYDSTGTRI